MLLQCLANDKSLVSRKLTGGFTLAETKAVIIMQFVSYIEASQSWVPLEWNQILFTSPGALHWLGGVHQFGGLFLIFMTKRYEFRGDIFFLTYIIQAILAETFPKQLCKNLSNYFLWLNYCFFCNYWQMSLYLHNL